MIFAYSVTPIIKQYNERALTDPVVSALMQYLWYSEHSVRSCKKEGKIHSSCTLLNLQYGERGRRKMKIKRGMKHLASFFACSHI